MGSLERPESSGYLFSFSPDEPENKDGLRAISWAACKKELWNSEGCGVSGRKACESHTRVPHIFCALYRDRGTAENTRWLGFGSKKDTSLDSLGGSSADLGIFP